MAYEYVLENAARLVIASSSILLVLFVALGASAGQADENGGSLDNGNVVWSWRSVDGRFRPARIEGRSDKAALNLNGECFQLVLDNDTLLKASDFKLQGPPEEETLAPQPASPTLARRFPGRQVVAKLSAADQNLAAEWRAILRDGATYVRGELSLRAVNKDVLVRKIILLDEKIPGARTAGTVAGSPAVASNFFFACGHPMAQNSVDGDGRVVCGFSRNAVLKVGETLTQSCLMGIAPAGQLRRGFLACIERERARPYQPFLHYNSWYDIAWSTRKYNESEALDVISQVGRRLVEERGVELNSFLFDDGWDDNQTLWKFHRGFPHGFRPLNRTLAKYGSGIGVWLSPFGGYATAKEQRLTYGREQGLETNAYGFSLAGPRYFQRFRDICLEMVREYGVNAFKFDGLAAGARASESGLTRDGDAMMRLVADLRGAKPNIYINQTTGTWPSPFWLLYVDSTWRGGEDHQFAGSGSWCQQWMTYRDAQTYKNIVQCAPLYPLNSLMLHGIIYASNAMHLDRMSDEDFAAQVREFFGTGTQLQELYITPALLRPRNWDDLAEAAKWARANADVLKDSHWIGGDPGRAQVYGWASWSPRKGILVLRNPADQPASFSVDVRTLFELPGGAPNAFKASSPWKQDRSLAPVQLRAGEAHPLALAPLEIRILETLPISELSARP